LIAMKFAQRCAKKVVLLDKNESMLKDAVDEVRSIAKGGCEVREVVADLSTREEVAAGMARVFDTVGHVTILVNNAGIVTGKKLLDSPDRQMELTMRVNTEAHFWTVKAVLPEMIERNHGHIVTIASCAGIVATPGLADYCASKFAAVGFDESLRCELRMLGKTGVKTTCVMPYFINTGMLDGVKDAYPWLLSTLSPQKAARRIVDAVLCNQPTLCMGLATNSLSLWRGICPTQVYDNMMDILGLLNYMDFFKGRTAAPSAGRS